MNATSTQAGGRSEGRCPVDALRAAEFPYLDSSGQAYLDYTGAALPPLTLVNAHRDRLAGGVFGNPHSASPAALASTRLVEEARSAVLEFCGAPPDTYVVIFTLNATAAVRLVAEAYPFGRRRPLLLLGDNHNSVLGMRRYAARRRATVSVAPLGTDFRGDDAAVLTSMETSGRTGPGLFAYPVQSNATGVRHSPGWVREAHRRGWHVLLDAAASLPTSPLDLRSTPADFVALSWYKITGFPSGVGCLLARRDALSVLDRPWFAGGTVRASSSHTDWHLAAPAPEGFEDGTLPFLTLPDVTRAAAWHSALGYPAIHRHTQALTARLLDGLAALRHPGGEPGARVLGPLGLDGRGPTVTFNLLRPNGTPLDERVCEHAAGRARISIRTGCFCNPGVAEQANGMTPALVRDALSHGDPLDVDGYLNRLRVHAQGAVRASVGPATDSTDVDRLLTVCQDVLTRPLPDPTAPRTGC